MYPALSSDVSMFPRALGIVLHNLSPPKYVVFKYIGNKSPGSRLPKVWSRLTKSVWTELTLLTVHFHACREACRVPLISAFLNVLKCFAYCTSKTPWSAALGGFLYVQLYAITQHHADEIQTQGGQTTCLPSCGYWRKGWGWNSGLTIVFSVQRRQSSPVICGNLNFAWV